MILYFLISLIYVLTNGFIRKIYTEDDWLLVVVHFLFYPVFLGLLIYEKINQAVRS
jgi:hypothetical protein